ncbi:MAG: transketolase [Suilimivivens sp.]
MTNDGENLAILRKQIFLAAYAAGKGHIASAFSAVEILYSLYMKNAMKYRSGNPQWEERDRFILSKGHASLALYATLAMAGVISEDELLTFCRPNSRLGGEPNTLELLGVEASTGSLGHGLSVGIGMALAFKVDGRKNHVYVLIGDGECQEGTIWEAAIAAKAFKLDNLTVILDRNRIQKMGFISDIIGMDSLREQFEAFGWQTKEVNGHDVEELVSALEGQWEKDAPRLVVADTIKGKGVSFMENQPEWHWRMPNKKELKVLKEELGISEEELEKCKWHI